MSLLLESYNDLLSQSRSLNDLNRINIAFGNTMTPQETAELDRLLFEPGYVVPALRDDRTFSDEELRDTARVWIESQMAHLQLIQKEHAEPFVRRDLRKSVTLYTDGNGPGGKTLVVALPGANHRLMMPTASLLQALSADRQDIVLIRDGTRSAYRQGLEGLADSLEAFADALPEFLNFDRYERVVGLGVSSGGLPILLISLRLGIDAVLTCGGASPFDPRWERPGDLSPVAMLEAAARDRPKTRVTVAFGAQSDPDRQKSHDIARCLGVEPLEVSADKGKVQHNILHPLAMEGRLPSFLADRLGL